MMTSGATFAAAAEACIAGGATGISVLALFARCEGCSTLIVTSDSKDLPSKPLRFTPPRPPLLHRRQRLAEEKGRGVSRRNRRGRRSCPAPSDDRTRGRRSVPQIFIDGIHVGGRSCDDLHALDHAGKLDPDVDLMRGSGSTSSTVGDDPIANLAVTQAHIAAAAGVRALC